MCFDRLIKYTVIDGVMFELRERKNGKRYLKVSVFA